MKLSGVFMHLITMEPKVQTMEEGKITKQKQFMLLYEPVHVRLNLYVQSIVRNREEAKDIISETVLKAYEHFEEIKKPESLLYYLMRVASNMVVSKERRNKFHGAFNEQASNNIPDYSSNIMAKTELNEFYAAVGKLPDKQREALVLFEISGMSLNEIRDIQGGSLSGVKSRIQRARTLLEEKLEYKKKITVNTQLQIQNSL